MTGPVEAEKGAFDLLPDGLLIADESGTVVLLNEAGTRLLRRSLDEALGRDYRDVLPLTDPAGRDWWRCAAPYTGPTIRKGHPERRLLLPDSRELLVASRYVREGRGGPVSRLVVSFRAAAARERAERDRAELISTVAHELRSPLTSVKGFTATLLHKWDRFTDEQRKLMLETVNADADRVTRLIGELLDVSRIDADRLELHRQVVDVAAAAARVIAGRVAAGESPQRFSLVVEGELPEVWLDPDKLDQVLANLVDNALRHGRGLVTVTVGATPDGGVALTVCDEGDGVPVELRPLVFRRFWRSGRRGGTGLGLYIVKGLVEAHGGTVEVGEAPGGGALFRVVFPAGTPAFMR
ncbi:MAG: PAS domain-containing sensor histidine kinase [Acidothermus sp.]|nr:PAS domain-containing sensor histidine kinase [Acidothermus sp.]